MKVTCFGSRGSIAAPSRKGFSTLEYGGNTSCYYVEAGDFRVILDHGTGAMILGDQLMREHQVGKHFLALSSHYHWDHIAGLPFFTPYYIQSNTFHIHGHEPPGHEGGLVNTVERLLSEQQYSPHFPVAHASFPSVRKYVSHSRLFSESFYYWIDEVGNYQMVASRMLDVVKETLPASIKMDIRRWLKITTIPLQHPDGCLGYRLDYMGKSIAYCTDNEPLRHTNAAISRIAKGVDLLIDDGQYSEQVLANNTQGFGHGTPRSCVEQAFSSDARELWISHHDPKADDQTLALMELDAQSYAATSGFTGVVRFAREGDIWEQG